jgi:hypothetical protein
MSDSEKKCNLCKIVKSVREFYTQKQKGNNGQIWNYYDSYCKPCRLKNVLLRRRAIKKQLVEYKGGKCNDCHLVDISEVYDFHHLDPSLKDFSISDKPYLSFEALRVEIDKCILLCANCHRKRHAETFKE